MKKKRSKFNLSHPHLTTCKLGQLFPILCMECVPGDSIDIQTEALVRLQALTSPVYDNIRCKIEYFFVPTRLIWEDYEAFYTGGVDGNLKPVYPTINSGSTGFPVSSIVNHLGVVSEVPNLEIGALQVRALNQVYNDWYINQNVEEPRVISKASGSDTTTDVSMMYRSWKLDRFNAGLPWAQRGDPVYLPLGTRAPVFFEGSSGDIASVKKDSSASGVGFFRLLSGSSQPVGIQDSAEGSVNNLFTDLSASSAVSVDNFNAAVQMQLAKSLFARAGSRIIEMISAFYGVRVPDYRVDRSEFIGGGSSMVSISEVLQTSQTSADSPQGNMSGHGISYNRVPRSKYFCQEFGYFIAFCSIVPDALYFQGVPRQFLRRTRWDIPNPIFQHLGEQPIYNAEIYAQGSSVKDADGNLVDEKTFAFEGRYNELRRMYGVVSGEFTKSLLFWSLAREFDKLPALNDTFVKCHPSTRIFADENIASKDPCLLNIYHKIIAKRPFAKRAIPGYMGHYS